MISGLMLLTGFFLMSADSIPVVAVGLAFITGVVCREEIRGKRKQKKEKSSRWQAYED